MAIIGIDLGGTKIAGAIFGQNDRMLAKKTILLNNAKGEKVGDLVVECIRTLTNDFPHEIVTNIGICVPGIVYSKTDTVWAPNIEGWDNFALKKHIQNNLQDTSISIHIESDRTCYILGEVWKGTAQGCNNAIYLAVGTGIGAGILLDGRVIHGANDIVGATGWLALQRPYREEYIPCGCFEYYASGEGIAKQAKSALRCEKNYTGVLSHKPIATITSYDVFEAYNQNDSLATKILDNTIELWGMGAANLVSLFNPEKIIFGGGIFGPAIPFIPRIYSEACKWGQPISMRDVQFCASEVKGEAALFGATYLAKINNNEKKV